MHRSIREAATHEPSRLAGLGLFEACLLAVPQHTSGETKDTGNATVYDLLRSVASSCWFFL